MDYIRRTIEDKHIGLEETIITGSYVQKKDTGNEMSPSKDLQTWNKETKEWTWLKVRILIFKEWKKRHTLETKFLNSINSNSTDLTRKHNWGNRISS